MDPTEDINTKILETCKALEELENEFTLLGSNFDPNLDPEQIEELENREKELFDSYYQQKRQLLSQFQQARRLGKISPTCQ
jgi:hypothetical protein